MPIRLRKTITSGVWNEMPNTSGRMIARPSHSFRRMSGSKPSHSLNIEQRLDRAGQDDELAQQHAGEEQPEARAEHHVDVLPLVRVQPGADERPELVEDERAGQHDAAEDRHLEVDDERLPGR